MKTEIIQVEKQGFTEGLHDLSILIVYEKVAT